ncbi:MAG: RusA family crossover junction endodeoxyribonuclease [Candidatus Moranbacteria bacterium]|nr:RusA family crossover junction endodeoxyribonuclease [Candidatus Moranbacteria bacterium]
MRKLKEIINPEIVYLQGNTLVPSKSIAYKYDGEIEKNIVIEKASTHKFENELKEDLKKELKNVNIFPTDKNVLVSIVHGINSGTEYKKCDLDNRAKCILDALKGVVYFDDSQVKMLWTHKAFIINSQESFFRISVKILDEEIIKRISSQISRLI